MAFQNMAQEVCNNIVVFLDTSSLQCARLASHSMNAPATEALFHTITLAPEAESRRRWNEISQDETIRQIPRRLVIVTIPDGLDSQDKWDPEDHDYYDEFDKIIRFPSLQAVQVVFSKDCSNGERRYTEVAESADQREETLKQVFMAVKSHHDLSAGEKRAGITSLALQNLQNMPLEDFTSSDLFLSVMGKMRELELCMIVEENEHGPDHDEFKKEVRQFPRHLRKKWLEPFSDKLEKLILYYRNIWGGVPGYFDGKGLMFPNLRSLQLGNLAICYDDQLDWLYEQKSLEKLGFFHCGIACRLYIGDWAMEGWDNQISTRDWRKTTTEEMYEDEFRYDGTWAGIFGRVASELPNLKDFRLGWNTRISWDKEEFDYRHNISTQLTCQRYFVYNSGILPDRWSEPDSAEEGAHGRAYGETEGDMEGGEGDLVNRHIETIEEDKKSFDELVKIVRERACK